MRRGLIVAAAWAALPLPAQTATPGDPVRITAPSVGLTNATGSLARVTAESLSYHSAAATESTVTIAKASITKLEVDYGNKQHHHVGKGALIGFGVGAIAGAIVGGQASCDASNPWNMCNTSFNPIAYAVVGGAIGAAGGAIFGAFITTPAWHQIDPAKLGVVGQLRIVPTWTPSQHRAGVVVSLRF